MRTLSKKSLNQKTPESAIITAESSHYVHTGEHLRVSSSKPKKAKKLHEQISDKSDTQKHLIVLLKQIGETEQASQTAMCCQTFATLTCGSHVAQTIPAFRCDFKLCPFCSHRPSETKIKKYLPLSDAFLKMFPQATACKLNLTQKQRSGETAVQSFERLQASVAKLVDRQFVKDNFLGGFGSYETTVSFEQNADGNWHFHVHLTVFRLGDWRPETGKLKELKRLWKQCSSGATNLWLSPVGSLDADLREQLKYQIKPASINDFDAARLKQYLKLKNRRMFFSFGKFKKFCAKPNIEDTGETVRPLAEETTGENGEPRIKLERSKISEETTERKLVNLRNRLVSEARERLLPARKEFTEGECCPVCQNVLFELKMTRRALIKFSFDVQPSRRE